MPRAKLARRRPSLIQSTEQADGPDSNQQSCSPGRLAAEARVPGRVTLTIVLGDLRINAYRPLHLNAQVWIVLNEFGRDHRARCNSLFDPFRERTQEIVLWIVARRRLLNHAAERVGAGTAGKGIAAMPHPRRHI
jgi:hypothetical protein